MRSALRQFSITSFTFLMIAVTCGVMLVGGATLHAQSEAKSGAKKAARPASTPIVDTRNIDTGLSIPSEGYADQPYIVTTRDGAWLCVMTTGVGVEGAGGQHVVSMRSTDQGRTWEKIVSIEPPDGPEASYAVLLKVPYGRIYAFYNHNTDRVTEVKREDKGVYKRVDSLGHYVFKYSDDHGRSWSAKRYDVPLREFECDRNNVYGGRLRFFWNVGRPLILGDAAIMVVHKVGAMGAGFFAQSEGAFFKSKTILTERDPEKITFETLPDGDIGLRTPAGGGRVAEEQSIVKLSDGSLYCVYRTVDGWPGCAYSRDGGHTWTQPAYASYTPGGRRIKHPRAANFAWNCSNGKFLYWFHNHGGPFIGKMLGDWGKGGGSPYDDRNPAWIVAGVERDGPGGKVIHWSQPEILLYDDDPYIRMSYPDLVEDGGKFYVTETQKNAARLHEIAGPFVDGLFNQWNNSSIARDGLLLDLPAGKPMPSKIAMPKLPNLNLRDTKRADYGAKDARTGFSIDIWLQLESLNAGQVLLDSRDASGKGIALTTTDAGTLRITLNDGRQDDSWDSDKGTVLPGKPQHVVITVDGGPKIITFVVNGVVCDGGDERQFGWGRYSSTLRTPDGSAEMQISAIVKSLRVYDRALRTSEAVGAFKAGMTNVK
ncbi:MAG: LamG-like jellyroll fold domain-containing protein [Limisphaerales bacterium]